MRSQIEPIVRCVFYEIPRFSTLTIRRQSRGLRHGLTSLTSREVTPEATDHRPLSSKILATDVYPVHYLFIPTRAHDSTPSTLHRLAVVAASRRERISDTAAAYAAAPGNFQAAFPVIGKRRAGERPALIMRLESARSGRRGEHSRETIPSRLLPPSHPL